MVGQDPGILVRADGSVATSHPPPKPLELRSLHLLVLGLGSLPPSPVLAQNQPPALSLLPAQSSLLGHLPWLAKHHSRLPHAAMASPASSLQCTGYSGPSRGDPCGTPSRAVLAWGQVSHPFPLLLLLPWHHPRGQRPARDILSRPQQDWSTGHPTPATAGASRGTARREAAGMGAEEEFPAAQ